MHGVPLIPISRYGKLNPNTMIVYQGEVDNEDKVGSNIENKIDEKPGQDEEPAIEKAIMELVLYLNFQKKKYSPSTTYANTYRYIG